VTTDLKIQMRRWVSDSSLPGENGYLNLAYLQKESFSLHFQGTSHALLARYFIFTLAGPTLEF